MSHSASVSLTRTVQLGRPDRLLLWAMRAWVIGMKRRVDAAEPIRMVFERFGIHDAAELVDALMSIVACGATRVLTIECVCHEAVSEDEQRLLVAASLHQSGNSFEASFMLRAILSATASRAAAELLDRLGGALRAGSLQLSSWTIETERLIFGAQPSLDPNIHPTIH
jgi:hypothetical protein